MDTDVELLEGWRAGDMRAGDELFRRHFAACRRFFATKVGADQVQDLVQRSFLGCLRGLSAFRGDCSFRTYLFVIARNELCQFLRSGREHIALESTSVRDLGTSPSVVVARSEEHRQLFNALQQLPVEDQTLLELFYWEGVSGPDLARVFDVAPATIRTRLHRARRSLREALERGGEGWSDERMDDSVRALRDAE